MANVQHSALTDPNLHEPKGIASANANEVYVADGSTSGAWEKISPESLLGISGTGAAGQFIAVDGTGNFILAYSAHGSVHYFDGTTGTTVSISAADTYTKANPTTTASGSPSFITEGTNARLTYTGTASIDLDVVFNVSLDQTSGSNKDVQAALFKNGTKINGSETIVTSKSGEKVIVSSHADVSMSTNDYVEVYVKNNDSTDDIVVYSFSMMASTAGA